jgi:hypothetical protein
MVSAPRRPLHARAVRSAVVSLTGSKDSLLMPIGIGPSCWRTPMKRARSSEARVRSRRRLPPHRISMRPRVCAYSRLGGSNSGLVLSSDSGLCRRTACGEERRAVENTGLDRFGVILTLSRPPVCGAALGAGRSLAPRCRSSLSCCICAKPIEAAAETTRALSPDLHRLVTEWLAWSIERYGSVARKHGVADAAARLNRLP